MSLKEKGTSTGPSMGAERRMPKGVDTDPVAFLVAPKVSQGAATQAAVAMHAHSTGHAGLAKRRRT